MANVLVDEASGEEDEECGAWVAINVILASSQCSPWLVPCTATNTKRPSISPIAVGNMYLQLSTVPTISCIVRI